MDYSSHGLEDYFTQWIPRQKEQ